MVKARETSLSKFVETVSREELDSDVFSFADKGAFPGGIGTSWGDRAFPEERGVCSCDC